MDFASNCAEQRFDWPWKHEEVLAWDDVTSPRIWTFYDGQLKSNTVTLTLTLSYTNVPRLARANEVPDPGYRGLPGYTFDTQFKGFATVRFFLLRWKLDSRKEIWAGNDNQGRSKISNLFAFFPGRFAAFRNLPSKTRRSPSLSQS